MAVGWRESDARCESGCIYMVQSSLFFNGKVDIYRKAKNPVHKVRKKEECRL